MYNPCELLNSQLLDRMIEHGNAYFVRQKYLRGITNPTDQVFILTHYKEKEKAQRHYDGIADTARYLYDTHKEEDARKLRIAASQPTGFKIYVALFKFDQWRPPEDLQRKLHTFLKRQTDFKGGQRKIAVVPFMHIGDVYVRISQGLEMIKVPLSDIENI